MKKLFMAILIITTLAPYVQAGQNWEDRWQKGKYKHQRTFMRDFDNDGIPNVVDGYDDEQHVPEIMRDYDHDGIPNSLDSFDNYWEDSEG